MRAKTLAAMLGVLIVLAALFITLKMRRGRHAADGFLIPLSMAKRTATISIATSSGTYELSRAADGWRVTKPIDFPADGMLVDTLLSDASKATLSAPLSYKKESLSYFGFDDKNRTEVTLSNSRGDVMGVITIGTRQAQEGDMFYALRGGLQNGVREVSGLSPRAFRLQPSQWLAKTIAAIKPDDIAAVKITSRRGITTILKTAKGWSAQGSSQKSVQAVIDLLGDFRAENTELKTSFSDTLFSPEITVTVTHPDGRTETFLIGPKDANGLRRIKKDGEGRLLFTAAGWKGDVFNITEKK